MNNNNQYLGMDHYPGNFEIGFQLDAKHFAKDFFPLTIGSNDIISIFYNNGIGVFLGSNIHLHVPNNIKVHTKIRSETGSDKYFESGDYIIDLLCDEFNVGILGQTCYSYHDNTFMDLVSKTIAVDAQLYGHHVVTSKKDIQHTPGEDIGTQTVPNFLIQSKNLQGISHEYSYCSPGYTFDYNDSTIPNFQDRKGFGFIPLVQHIGDNINDPVNSSFLHKLQITSDKILFDDHEPVYGDKQHQTLLFFGYRPKTQTVKTNCTNLLSVYPYAGGPGFHVGGTNNHPLTLKIQSEGRGNFQAQIEYAYGVKQITHNEDTYFLSPTFLSHMSTPTEGDYGIDNKLDEGGPVNISLPVTTQTGTIDLPPFNQTSDFNTKTEKNISQDYNGGFPVQPTCKLLLPYGACLKNFLGTLNIPPKIKLLTSSNQFTFTVGYNTRGNQSIEYVQRCQNRPGLFPLGIGPKFEELGSDQQIGKRMANNYRGDPAHDTGSFVIGGLECAEGYILPATNTSDIATYAYNNLGFMICLVENNTLEQGKNLDIEPIILSLPTNVSGHGHGQPGIASGSFSFQNPNTVRVIAKIETNTNSTIVQLQPNELYSSPTYNSTDSRYCTITFSYPGAQSISKVYTE